MENYQFNTSNINTYVRSNPNNIPISQMATGTTQTPWGQANTCGNGFFVQLPKPDPVYGNFTSTCWTFN